MSLSFLWNYLHVKDLMMERRLIDYSAGGVFVVGGGGKIDINNTIEERLVLLQDNALPSIRTELFGKNENRKFYD